MRWRIERHTANRYTKSKVPGLAIGTRIRVRIALGSVGPTAKIRWHGVLSDQSASCRHSLAGECVSSTCATHNRV